MSSAEIYYTEILSDIALYIYKFVLPIVYILANIGNLLTALIFTKKSWRKNVCIFYFNVCLFVSTINLNIYILGSILITGFNIQTFTLNRYLCKVYYYFFDVCLTLLPSILISTTIDRLLITSKNVNTRLYSSKRLAYFLTSLSFFIWMTYNIQTLIRVNIQQIAPSTYICSYDLTKSYLQFISFSLLIITCGFSIIMIILLIFAFKNIQHIQSFPRQQHRGIRTMTKKDFQLLRCLYTFDMIYIVSNICIGIFYVFEAARLFQPPMYLETAISDFISKMLIIFSLIPNGASFGIFMIGSKAFRLEWKHMIKRCMRQEMILRREEENIGVDNVELNPTNSNAFLV